MSSLKNQVDQEKLPRHIAIIMDGNGRWAKQKGKFRIFGHRYAVNAVRETVEAAAEIGVQYLTLYAFSTENWKRPKMEVDALMELLVSSIHKERDTLKKNDIRLQAIGDLNSLPKGCVKELNEAFEYTKDCKRMTLILALSYSAKWELLEAIKNITEKVVVGTISKEQINEQLVSEHLSTAGYPDPELMIRTSGEHRISNFLLWQMAYAELYFTNTLWPDFTKEHLYEAILDFQKRERRFGLTSEQLT
jgi:undecaprenyl diphosphate synthase